MELLKKHFGFDGFRAHQEEIIQAVLAKRDVLAVLPTGSGKSLCYQFPAVLQTGTCVVISPLIALMKDQVDAMTQNGVPAVFINSTLTGREVGQIQAKLKDIKLLYISPERLMMPHFLEFLKHQSISFFAVDEAHCISQWGHAFRPEYRQLSVLKEVFPDKPILALTATATQRVEEDISGQLHLAHPAIVKGSFNRPNLLYRVFPRTELEAVFWSFLELHPGESGIIYGGTKKRVDEFHARLLAQGHTALKYHAGMSDQERKKSQEAFLQGDGNLMTATVAFGMGIHKPDIRFIIHLDMPQNLEQYYQETGRAGRDGLESECLLFYSAADFMLHKYFLGQFTDPLIKQEMMRKLQDMLAFCQTRQCRRVPLLSYFGETSEGRCQKCDNCLPLEKRSFKPAKPALAKRSSSSRKVPPGAQGELFQELRALRKTLAAQENVPSYIIFGDRALLDMCRLLPQTPQAFLQVYGVGQQKLDRYGPAFLGVLKRYASKPQAARA